LSCSSTAALILHLSKFYKMALNTILKIFLPKDKIFHTLFEDSSNRVQLMAELLKKMIHAEDAELRGNTMKQIEDLENKNDEVTHRIFIELSQNFITPFDREDIHYLATALDDVADYIYSGAKKINFYHINTNDDGLRNFADLILESSKFVKVAVAELRDMKNLRNITESIISINNLEKKADHLFDINVERLFNEEQDAKEIIKMKEIYQVLENATDKCEDAGNVIESIIVKYA